MRGDNKRRFFYGNKKVKKYIDQIDDLTIEEIDKLNLSKWLREGLKEIKEGRLSRTNELTPQDIIRLAQTTPKQQSYKLYRFTQPTQFVGDVEIFENELAVVIDDEILKVSKFEMSFTKYGHLFKYIKDIKSVEEYVKIKNKDDWDKIYPGESQVEEKFSSDGVNTTRQVGGVNVSFRKL